MKKHKKKYDNSICKACICELQFELLQVKALYNALDEIVSMTNDPLAKKIAELAKERHQIDKLIHARLLFSNNK